MTSNYSDRPKVGLLTPRPASHLPLFFIYTFASIIVLLRAFAAEGGTEATFGLAIGIIGVMAGLTVGTYGKPSLHPLSLLSLVTISHVLLFVLRPAYAVIYQGAEGVFSNSAYDDRFVHAQIVAAIGFVAICFGYRMGPGCQNGSVRPRHLEPIPRSQWPAYSVLMWTVVIIGFGLYGTYVLLVGPSRWWMSISGGRTEASREAIEGFSAYLYSGNQFAFGALIFIALQAGATARKGKAALIGALLMLASFPAFASGSRSIFIPLVVAIVYVAYIIRPSIARVHNLVLWGPAAFVLLIIVPRLWRSSSATNTTLGDAVSTSFTVESAVGDFVGGLDTAMVDAFLHQIEGQADGTIDYTFGASYLGLLFAFVPRSIWADKPLPVDSHLNSIIFPKTYSQGTGFSFGFYSEPYLSFGAVGVVTVCFVVGYVISKLSDKCIRSHGITHAFVLIIVASYIFPIFRGSLSFDLQRLLMPLLPVLIMLLVGRFFLGLTPHLPRNPIPSAYNSSRKEEFLTR